MKNINVIKQGTVINLSIDGKLHKKVCGSAHEADSFYKLVLVAKTDPSDENVKYGSNYTAKYKDNEFQATRKDGFGIAQGIDDGLDTSIPLTLSISYYVKGTDTGDTDLERDPFDGVTGKSG